MASYNYPGVYVEEISTIPPSVAGVSTAIPAFIGYTESGYDPAEGVVPKRIENMVEYKGAFGGPRNASITVTTDSNDAITGVTVSPLAHFMYHNVEMYFKNGGGPCYIASVGSYQDTHARSAFDAGMSAVEKEDEPTLLVFTETVNLGASDYYGLCQDALTQCNKLGDRFAILDVLESDDNAATGFRNGVSSDYLKYGASYYPYLKTTLNYSYDESQVTVGAGTLADTETSKTTLYNAVKTEIAKQRITMPPSGAIAGVYARVDREKGVWKAPANATIASVTGPAVELTNAQQAILNVDAQSGKSVNAIRSFPGKGTLVWGARTLAGNDNEWRYVPVRRLFNMIEESTKKATDFAVFEPNDPTTWFKVKAMIESFLYNLWQQGAMAGSSSSAAYYVNVGLGRTMTNQDILEGRMIVEIGIAAVRPAEFIVLRFSHKMQE
jgi:hypothetical protein